MSEQVTCEKHGRARAAYVCPHVLESLKDRTKRGFNWFEDDDGDVQAFCTFCWEADDEEWEQMTGLGPKLLCLRCAADAAVLNGVDMELEG